MRALFEVALDRCRIATRIERARSRRDWRNPNLLQIFISTHKYCIIGAIRSYYMSRVAYFSSVCGKLRVRLYHCFEGGHCEWALFRVHCSLLPKAISVANGAMLDSLGNIPTTLVLPFTSLNSLSKHARHAYPGLV